MSRLARDGTAEPVWRNQILRHERGQGNMSFPVQLTTSGIGNLTWLLHTITLLAIRVPINTYTQQHFGQIKNEVFFTERGLLSLKGPVGQTCLVIIVCPNKCFKVTTHICDNQQNL